MKKILIAIVCFAVVCLLAFPQVVFAGADNSNGDEICKSYSGDPNYQYICGGGKEGDAVSIVTNILEAVFGITAILATVVIIIGGVMYMTSRGSEDKVKRAKDAILYAVIGLIVSIAAYAIVNFVLNNVKG